MKIIYLIRHGDKIPEAGDPGLTFQGKIQARKTGEYFKKQSVDQIISSTYKRAIQTAKEMGIILDLSVHYDDRLGERMNWNSEETDFNDFASEWIKSTKQRGYVPEGGDSSIETGNRISDLVSDLEDDTTTIMVTHGGAIIDYLRNYFDDSVFESLLAKFKYGFDYRYDNCAITKIVVEDDGVDEVKIDLKFLHYTKHL